MALPGVCILILLMGLPPLLLARRFLNSPSDQDCAMAVLLPLGPFAIAMLLDLGSIPLRSDTLLLSHSLYAAFSLLLCLPGIRRNHTLQRPLFPLVLLPLALLLFPYTRFTGIDTYKWQDLATAIQMEQTIPWHIHPVGMLGFLPRSYPSLQPVLLASIQMLGQLGVEGGFRILTLLILAVGFTTSHCWFARLLPAPTARLCACCYALSPVFVRYIHWTTGRGLFVALLPALLYYLTPASPSATATRMPSNRSRLHRLAGIAVVAALLLLSHKAAWIALPLLLTAALGQRFLPRPTALRLLLLAPALMLAVLLSRRIGLPGLPGQLAGALWSAASRFSWMLPVALWAWSKPGAPQPRSLPLAPLAFLLSVPLAFDPQMYGALIALPWMVYLSVPCAQHMLQHLLKPTRYHFIPALLLLGLLLPSGAVLLSRSRMAASAELKQAALFLNAHDPEGPFMLHAPMPARTRLQAYATGCPRFVLSGQPTLVTRLRPPPHQHNPFHQPGIQHWTAWLRHLIHVEGLQVEWYGNVQRHYHVTVEGLGTVPPGAVRVFRNASVQIFRQGNPPAHP